jgi:hypothetical protein
MKKILVLAMVMAVTFAFSNLAMAGRKGGAGISQTQNGSVFQTQNGNGINLQGYNSGGIQSYNARMGAIKVGRGQGSGVVGVVGASQYTDMSGSQFNIGHPQNQFGTYNNNQSGVVYAY